MPTPLVLSHESFGSNNWRHHPRQTAGKWDGIQPWSGLLLNRLFLYVRTMCSYTAFSVSACRWCIYLRHRSSGAYETLRKSGCLNLPSQRTLRDYTHVVSSRMGFSREVDTMLMENAKISTCPDHQKFIILTFDEMHIRADLVYENSKNTGELVGFCDIGDINNYLHRVERSLEENPKPELAKTMLVFMIRRLFGIALQFPYAQFSARDLCGDQIFDPFWDAVYHLVWF